MRPPAQHASLESCNKGPRAVRNDDKDIKSESGLRARHIQK